MIAFSIGWAILGLIISLIKKERYVFILFSIYACIALTFDLFQILLGYFFGKHWMFNLIIPAILTCIILIVTSKTIDRFINKFK